VGKSEEGIVLYAFRRARLAAVILATALLIVGTAAPAAAVTVGTTEGCTPGYWKNHLSAWQEYSPNQSISSAFSAAASTPYGSLTLRQGLNLDGGSGISGAQRILLRHAIAALLNASYDPLAYPWQREGSAFRPPLLSTVNNALLSGSRTTMLSLAAQLDRDNNLGCPLN